jgi:hypothetical protein
VIVAHEHDPLFHRHLLFFRRDACLVGRRSSSSSSQFTSTAPALFMQV